MLNFSLGGGGFYTQFFYTEFRKIGKEISSKFGRRLSFEKLGQGLMKNFKYFTSSIGKNLLYQTGLILSKQHSFSYNKWRILLITKKNILDFCLKQTVSIE